MTIVIFTTSAFCQPLHTQFGSKILNSVGQARVASIFDFGKILAQAQAWKLYNGYNQIVLLPNSKVPRSFGHWKLHKVKRTVDLR